MSQAAVASPRWPRNAEIDCPYGRVIQMEQISARVFLNRSGHLQHALRADAGFPDLCRSWAMGLGVEADCLWLRLDVADGVPMYILDRNPSLLQRMMTAPHRLDPDALEPAKEGVPVEVVLGGGSKTGNGATRMLLSPLRPYRPNDRTTMDSSNGDCGMRATRRGDHCVTGWSSQANFPGAGGPGPTRTVDLRFRRQKNALF